jgi:zinc transport system substrate-binding protein
VESDDTPHIFAVNYPIAYFAEMLAGDSIVISFPAPANVDPANWQPDTDTIIAYQRADLVLLNGAGYARWVRQVSLPQLRLVDTGAAYTNDLIAIDIGPAHSHGPEGAHNHGEFAFTTWLDLKLAQQQVAAIAAAMQKLMPLQRARIAQRAATLTTELTEIDQALVQVAAGLRGLPIVFSHPVYQYFERRYQISGPSVHWEPDKMPTSAQWETLAAMQAREPARFMIWEAEPLAQIRERLREMGLDVVVYQTLGNRPVQDDFMSVMRANVRSVEMATSQFRYQTPEG